jgi:integrase
VRALPERQPRQHYDVSSYRRTVGRACAAAGVEPWHPHQLRHNVATEVRRRFGIEMAQAALGHRTPAMTALYAEASLEKIRGFIGQIG